MRALTEGLRQEAGDRLRVTLVTPGFVRTDFIDSISDLALHNSLAEARDRMAMAPEMVARAISFAIEQPADVDVGEIVVRPTAQGWEPLNMSWSRLVRRCEPSIGLPASSSGNLVDRVVFGR